MCVPWGGGLYTRKSAHICQDTGDMTDADFDVVWLGGSSLHSACVLHVGWLCVAGCCWLSLVMSCGLVLHRCVAHVSVAL